MNEETTKTPWIPGGKEVITRIDETSLWGFHHIPYVDMLQCDQDLFKQFFNRQEQTMKYTDVTKERKTSTEFSELGNGAPFLNPLGDVRIKTDDGGAVAIHDITKQLHYDSDCVVQCIRIVNVDYEVI